MVERSLSGIFNMGGAEYLSRYDFALKVAEIFGFKEAEIAPIKTDSLKQKAKRPSRGGLKTLKAQGILKTKLLSVKEGLKRAKESQKTG